MPAPTVSDSSAIGYTSVSSTSTVGDVVSVGDVVLVLEIWQGSSAPPTLSDSQGGTYSTVENGQSGFIVSGGSWYRVSRRTVTAANSNLVVTSAKSDGYVTIFTVIVSGGVSSVQSTKLDDSAAPWSISITTTQADALLIGFWIPENQATMSSIDGTPTGFSELQEILDFSFWGGVSAQRTAATVGTYTWTPTAPDGNIQSSGLVLVALYPEVATLEWRPSTPKIRAAGVMAPGLSKVRVGGVWVPSLPKNRQPI